MGKSLKAVYENGLLRPLEPLSMCEQEQVTITILDEKETHKGNESGNCYDIALRIGIIGMMDNAPHDLSANPEYMKGI